MGQLIPAAVGAVGMDNEIVTGRIDQQDLLGLRVDDRNDIHIAAAGYQSRATGIVAAEIHQEGRVDNCCNLTLIVGHRLIYLVFTNNRTGGQRLLQLAITLSTLGLLNNGHFIEHLCSGTKVRITCRILQSSGISAAQQDRIHFPGIQRIRHFRGQRIFNSRQGIPHCTLQLRDRLASLLCTDVLQGCKGIFCRILDILCRIVRADIDSHQSRDLSLASHVIHSLAELGRHAGNTGAAQNNQRHQNQRSHLPAGLALLFLLEQKDTRQYPNQRKQRCQNHNIQSGQQI